MVFVKTQPLNYDELPINTKLRFLEIELNAAINQLTPLFTGTSTSGVLEATSQLASYLAQDKTMLKDDLIHAFSSKRFRYPTREEILQYFRYRNIGVAKIVKYASVSPNTIQGMKDSYPNFTPVFPSWTIFPVLVIQWDNLKNNFNLFNDQMLQSHYNHTDHLDPTQYK